MLRSSSAVASALAVGLLVAFGRRCLRCLGCSCRCRSSADQACGIARLSQADLRAPELAAGAVSSNNAKESAHARSF